MVARERGLMTQENMRFKIPYFVESIEKGNTTKDEVLKRIKDAELKKHFEIMTIFSKKVNSIGFKLKKLLLKDFFDVRIYKSCHFSHLYDAVLAVVLEQEKVAYVHFHTKNYHMNFNYSHKGIKPIHELQMPYDLLAFSDVDANFGELSHFYLMNNTMYLDFVDGLAEEIARNYDELEDIKGSLFEKFKNDIRFYLPDFKMLEIAV